MSKADRRTRKRANRGRADVNGRMAAGVLAELERDGAIRIVKTGRWMFDTVIDLLDPNTGEVVDTCTFGELLRDVAELRGLGELPGLVKS